MTNMKKNIYLFSGLFAALFSLCSCDKKISTCYAASVVENNGSVKCQVLFDNNSDLYYFKSLEEGERRHFVGRFYDDIYFYSNKKIVKKGQEGYQELKEKALNSTEVYVDFQRTYVMCSDEKGNNYDKYAPAFVDKVYEDYTFATAKCVYFEKMSDEYYQSTDFDLNYGRFD